MLQVLLWTLIISLGRLREDPSTSECASFRAKFHTAWSEMKFGLST